MISVYCKYTFIYLFMAIIVSLPSPALNVSLQFPWSSANNLITWPPLKTPMLHSTHLKVKKCCFVYCWCCKQMLNSGLRKPMWVGNFRITSFTQTQHLSCPVYGCLLIACAAECCLAMGRVCYTGLKNTQNLHLFPSVQFMTTVLSVLHRNRKKTTKKTFEDETELH